MVSSSTPRAARALMLLCAAVGAHAYLFAPHRPTAARAVLPRRAAIVANEGRRLSGDSLSEAAPSTEPGAIGAPYPGPPGLVSEKDGCGVGFLANLNGERTHEIVSRTLRALGCMEHRGACGGDKVSGDGAGVMTAVPWELIASHLEGKPTENCGVGMLFLPHVEADKKRAKEIMATNLEKHGLQVLGYREVPVDVDALGLMARAAMPAIEQIIVYHPDLTGDELEEKLYLSRRSAQADAWKETEARPASSMSDFYLCSLSSRTIVYKGMVQSSVLPLFYKDLVDPSYTTSWAIYHRRFSTNTVPKWPLAQPMRLLGHNGEINTVVGNVNWQRALDVQRNRRAPLCTITKSDSANLDSVFEWLVRSGKSASHALSVLVPEAYKDQPEHVKTPEISEMYEYYAGLQEPWDGPALIVFSDGKQVGAGLDRNGLRPARYLVTKGGMVAMMSETGVVDVPDSEIIEKGRLGPGHMIIADLETGEFLDNMHIKTKLANNAPYGKWMKEHSTLISRQSFSAGEVPLPESTVQQLTAFGWSSEDLDMQIADMGNLAKETLFSMGDDTPLAILSEKPRPLYDYFKQRFAQVTNPAIDPLREGVVMGLGMAIGERFDLSRAPAEELANQVRIESPIVNAAELDKMREAVPHTILSTLYPISKGPEGLKEALNALSQAAEKAVLDGLQMIELSDESPDGLASDTTFIPPLLAVGAVHHHLIAKGLRLKASIVVSTGQAWSTHHIACLVGYGASAVHPYLAFQAVRFWYDMPRSVSMRKAGRLSDITLEQALSNYRAALEAGLLKILSKIGISLLSSYHGAQIFEAIGLGAEIIDTAFIGTPSRVGGLSLSELAEEVGTWHGLAFTGEEMRTKLQNYGFIKYFSGNMEHHHNSPPLTRLLHKALEEKSYDMFKLFQASIETAPATTLRDMLEPVADRPPVPLERVEPVSEIMKRFCTGGMSLGALSREAHETLAIGVNRFGGKSNSGEGGEDSVRWQALNDVDEDGHSPTLPHLKGLRNGDIATSKIKQVASGRFGVTPEYLRSADQIEIKIAQGAKPGEGGQLPGVKIDQYIASIRYSKAGVTLISPPPHHDIYSIEDLAQLIYDLHMISPAAKVSVKLVSCVGIGTVAAGVAKANADVIQVSGHDGGTGASPLSSIKHAGGPWELGLAEVHQSLMLNQLRQQVILRVDGGFKTGYDVVMGALLGADEFGFGTIAMIAEGCIMARICHTNSCPVGVTTQKEALRKKFTGTPENVLDYFGFVAEETRHVLAQLGYTSLSDVIGRADLLKPRDRKLHKTKGLDLKFVRDLPNVKYDREWAAQLPAHSNGPVLDDELLANPDVVKAILDNEELELSVPICNTDRAVGARLAGEIAMRHGNRGWSGKLDITFTGCAGQSFGSFAVDGLHYTVVGDANDYVAKGMHGGRIVVVPPKERGFDPTDAVIVGNTCLYGATGGKFFAHGRAGERFGVRNSNAQAVVEGTGDHCCEYMTGGVVVVLGKIGRNAAAGMTGGLAYLLEEGSDYEVASHVNMEVVKMQRVTTKVGAQQLRGLIEEYHEATGSEKAAAILKDWESYLPRFWQLVPPSEAGSPEASDVTEEAKVVA